MQGDDHGTKEGKVSLSKQSTDLCIFSKPSTNPTGLVEMFFGGGMEGGGGGAGEFEFSGLIADNLKPASQTFTFIFPSATQANNLWLGKTARLSYLSF